VAGLSAAERLGKAGQRVLVVEARDRVGGRVFSLPGLTPEHAFELGAEFVHGKPRLLDEYLRQHKLKLFETEGQSYCALQGELRPCDGPSTNIFEKLDKLSPQSFPDESFEQSLARLFPDASDDAKRWARSFVQGFHAADAARISTHSIILGDRAERETEGDRGFHIAGGYGRLIEALCVDVSEAVSIRSGARVSRIEWSRNQVMVAGTFTSGEAFRFEAPHVVITLPLSILQRTATTSGAVQFDPPLREKQGALNQLAMGPVVRVTLQFASMFWEDAAVMGTRLMRDLHFLFTQDPVFPTFWTWMPLRVPVLVAWSAGPLAEQKAGHSAVQVELEALEALSRVLFLPVQLLRNRFVRSYFHDWQADPYSLGAYSYVLAGGMGAQAELAKPLARKLFFAGEATQSDGHHATVHGAFASGWRVAREVLERL
jgi:monoamine oxidase